MPSWSKLQYVKKTASKLQEMTHSKSGNAAYQTLTLLINRKKISTFFNTKIHFSYHLNNENTRLNPIFRRNVDIIVGFLQRTVNGLVHDNGIGCLCCADNIHTSWLFPHYWWKTWIFSQSVQSDSLKIFRRLCGFSFEKIVSIFKNKSPLLKLNSIVIHS